MFVDFLTFFSTTTQGIRLRRRVDVYRRRRTGQTSCFIAPVCLWRVVEGRFVLALETGKVRLPTVDRRTGGTARRWEAQDRNRCLDVMSARRVKHDCRYPGTVPLQSRWTAMDVVEPWRACCDRPTRYERNHRRTGPIQNDLTRKQNYNSKTVDDQTYIVRL